MMPLTAPADKGPAPQPQRRVRRKRDGVSDQALLLMLAAVKKLVPLDRASREGDWRRGPSSPMQHLHGQTLGLVACGHIGRAFALRRKPSGSGGSRARLRRR